MATRKTAARPTVATRHLKKVAAAPDRKHTVKASLRNVDLTKATSALNLVLRADGEKLGELVVGRGSFFWYARNSKKRQRITWSDFADLMDKHAK
ncbi:hypothetical protein [Arenimonas terrae]|jgi:hypothetical protein|uniref:Uncharacterized protein n=1 Tax=Arenimonas terrae TaxID=2546226 RepID=A0A5C4RTA3_9GAMM|nr:hypothetical protein [Arenimonas terrae]TNJ34410.1 hypothetical protein E1B00_01060 [Arenimonas terrae]